MTPRIVARARLLIFLLMLVPPGLAREGKPESTDLVSVRIFPENVTLWGSHASQHFIVLARGSDGLERDVTAQANFTLAEKDEGEIDTSGKFVAGRGGEVALTARVAERSAKATIRVEGADQPQPFAFARDIGGILTKRGCNDTACHGSVKGRNGFKLSVYGLLPREDYKRIVEGGTFRVLTTDENPKIPRIDTKEPEKSILLLKPTFTVPHGGGIRFSVGSPDYLTLLNWIKSGAPYGDAPENPSIALDRVDVFPKEIVLDAHGRQQLIVTGYLSNGHQEDLTDQARYVSETSDVADVNDAGLIKAKKTGESNIFIRTSGGHALSATVGVIQHPIPNYPKLETRNYIDEYVFSQLRRFQLLPSHESSDEEFLRRVCLDIAGTLPPPRRVREFLADKDPDKRDRLIEILLNSPEYVDYWSFRFNDLLRTTIIATDNPERTKAYEDWVVDSIAANKPYDQMARERIASQGYSAAARNFFYVGELTTPETLMPELIRLFLGRRIECAQCHNHPFEPWTQNQFWGLAAFFSGYTDVRESALVIDVLGGGHVDQPKEMVVRNPRTKEKIVPTYLDGTMLPSDQWMDPRLHLANWIISHPYFSEAIVNRIWSYFFGRGIVDPVDDFRSTNPPSNPELLEALAKDFVDGGYDLKHLMRTIAQSKTYQLSGIPNESNREDKINYSHSQTRALDAAVLLDAITSATAVPEKFHFHPYAKGGEPPPGVRAMQTIPEICPSQFMDAFGRSMRSTLPLGPPKPNLLEALDMFAGPAYTSKISEPGGRLDQLLKNGATNGEILDEFYLAALARFPTAREKARLLDFLNQRSALRRQTLERLVWAIMNSREFAYNH